MSGALSVKSNETRDNLINRMEGGALFSTGLALDARGPFFGRLPGADAAAEDDHGGHDTHACSHESSPKNVELRDFG